MAVFAWAPGRDPSGFAANLTAGAIRFGLERRGEFLPEVMGALARAFAGTPRAEIRVHLVGDLVGEPLQSYFPESPPIAHCCSLHLEAALRSRGFEDIDKGLASVFEGDAATGRAGGQRAGARAGATGDNRRFSFASLDLHTGRLIVQAAGTVAETKAAVGSRWLEIEAEYERDRAHSLRGDGFSPMANAAGPRWDMRTVYYVIEARAFSVACVVATLLLLLLRMLPVLLQDEQRELWEPGGRWPWSW